MLLFPLLFACGEKDKPQTGELHIYLIDAPAGYSEVNINIRTIEFITDKSTKPTKVELSDKPINLLKLSNGIDTLIAKVKLNVSTLKEIRLYMGENNSVVTNGTKHSLSIPSEVEAIVELNIEQLIEDGGIYKIWIDFDASRSIVKRGNDRYQLVPIVRAFSEFSSGSVRGQIYPRTALPFIWACTVADTIGTIADSTGYFLIKNLPADTYNLKILPQNGMDEIIVEKIIVESGRTTDAGSIALH